MFESSHTKDGPPIGFQFPSPKTDQGLQFKQRACSARRLGNLRRNGKITSLDEVSAARAKAAALRSTNQDGYVPNKPQDSAVNEAKTPLKSSGKNRQHRKRKSSRNSVESSNFPGRNDQGSYLHNISGTLNAKLGGPKVRKNSVKIPSTFMDQVLDASKDQYRIHKWRQRSSRRKLAGMYGSPEVIKNAEIGRQEKISGVKRSGKARNYMQLEEHCSNIANDAVGPKPRVPLPGTNFLPAMYVRDRSDQGSRAPGQREVTLSFARNAAMEELERRFHNGRWKSKKSGTKGTKNVGAMDAASLPAGEIRSTRRNILLRNAASLRLAPLDDEGNHRPSVTRMLESVTESPEKIVQDDTLLEKSSVPELSTEWKVGVQVPLSDAIQYKMIKDTVSEETVTIISKPSDTMSPKKDSISIFSNSTVPLEQVIDGHRGGINSKGSLYPREKSIRKLTGNKYPVLPAFPNAGNSLRGSDREIFDQLHETMHKSNEHQYQKFSRKNLPGNRESEQKANPILIPRGERAVLPPIYSSSKQRPAIISEYRKNKTVSIGTTEKEGVGDFAENVSPSGTSLKRKVVAHSSKTSPLSHVSATGLVKDTTTPVDSISSRSTGRRQSTKWRRRSIRGESGGSPQFLKAQKQTKLAKLMGKWKVVNRLIILFRRLYDSHHMVSDDSFNIHFVRNRGDDDINAVKPEVLFDVTDYKMKNQLGLSETTRRVLSTSSEDRTNQDVRLFVRPRYERPLHGIDGDLYFQNIDIGVGLMDINWRPSFFFIQNTSLVQTSLRNIKAISDHSAVVQSRIARYGYVSSFGVKRVVVREDRPALNYYVLLAGSAVVVKSDENGNTSPAWFMKRGDVFGERQILNNSNWEWSVVTVDPCDFLLLTKDDYTKIFLAGGSADLLSDPDRGTFLRNLSLFQGWPMDLLASYPNRCLFRYYKRGTLLSRDNAESEWIYVIKSGSCSVLKPLKVEKITTKEIFKKLLAEQTAVLPVAMIPELVQRKGEISKEGHLERINEIATALKTDQMSVATSYKQIEIASLLKELNIDIHGGALTPVDEQDESEEMEADSSSEKQEPDTRRKTITINVTDGDIEPQIPPHSEGNGEFRLDRVSDRTPARTPSPMKAVYLQTGISRGREEGPGTKEKDAKGYSGEIVTGEPYVAIGGQNGSHTTESHHGAATENLSLEDFLSKLDSSSESDESRPPSNEANVKPVYVNVRKLTKGSSFGLGPILFSDQPSLALISNGAECLLLNKKFYLDNMTDEVLKNLRAEEHPYPSEYDLRESYWRLISWKAFQRRTVKELRRDRRKAKHYISPPKTDVY